MTNEKCDEWGANVLSRIRLHQRRDVAGLWSMLNDGLLDVFDILVVAPLLLNERQQELEMAEYERRRLKWLDSYEPDWKRIKKEDSGENHIRGQRASNGKSASPIRQNQRARHQDLHARRDDKTGIHHCSSVSKSSGEHGAARGRGGCGHSCDVPSAEVMAEIQAAESRPQADEAGCGQFGKAVPRCAEPDCLAR